MEVKLKSRGPTRPEYVRQWRLRNLDRIRAVAREYQQKRRASHPEWAKAEARRFSKMYRRDPEKRLRMKYNSMVHRCTEPQNARYASYGGRGITVYAEWLADREKFVEYAKTLPDWDVLDRQLDRIDNDGNYQPGNLRFTTRKVNMQNRRKIGDLQTRILELEAEVRRLSK